VTPETPTKPLAKPLTKPLAKPPTKPLAKPLAKPPAKPPADGTDPMFTEGDQAAWRDAQEQARREDLAREREDRRALAAKDAGTPQPDPVAGTDGVLDDTDEVLAGSFPVQPTTPTYKAAAPPSTPAATLEYIDLGEEKIAAARAAARAAFEEADRAVNALAPMARDNMPAYLYSVEQRTKALDYLKSLEQQLSGSPRISQPDPPLGPQSEYFFTREARTQEMMRNWYNLSPDEKKKQSGRYFNTIVGLTNEFKNDPWVARNDWVFQQFVRDVAAGSLAATDQTTDLGSQ